MTLHITPTNDLREHIEESICWCEPEIEIVNGEMIIIHNSLDGREYLEEAEDILKMKIGD